MLKNARNASRAKDPYGGAGCSCCNTKQHRRSVKHSMKLLEEKQWKEEAQEEILSDDEYVSSFDDHLYEAERCIFCNSNMYDNWIYGDAGCSREKGTYIYTTETSSDIV